MHTLTPITEAMSTTVVTQAPSQKVPVQAINEALTTPAEKEEVPRETKQSPEVDQKFAALTRKERELLRIRRELQQKEKSLEEKYSKFKPYEEAQEIAKQSKLKALEKLGFSYDDLTNEFLGQANMTPEQLAEAKAHEIVEKRLQAYEQQNVEKQKQLQEQVISQARRQLSQEAQSFASEKSQEFPIVNSIKGFDTVSEYIEQKFYETGKLISIEEGVKDYETFIEDEILKIASIDKIRSRLLAKEEPKTVPVTPAANQQPKTITNKGTVAAPSGKPMTYEEKKRAIMEKYART